MTLDEARTIAKQSPRITTKDLDLALVVLTNSDDDADEQLADVLYDERDRRDADEPPYDTPSLDLPTYGA